MLVKVNSDVRGIVWLTDKPLSQFPMFFNDLDYLFDGLIAKHVANFPNENAKFEKNVFSGQSFNRDLVLIHIWDEDKARLEKELAGALALIPAKEEHPHVLVIGENAESFPEKALKKKGELRFDYFKPTK